MQPLDRIDLTMQPTSSPCASSITTGFSPEKFRGVTRASLKVFSSTVAQPSQNSRTTAMVSSSKPEGDLASESLPRRPATS